MVRVVWRGQPAWVLRRGKAMLDRLAGETLGLKDPESNESIQPSYAKNAMRALRPEYLVVIATCTHLGCVPVEQFEPGSLGADWPGPAASTARVTAHVSTSRRG